jgi:nitroreductase
MNNLKNKVIKTHLPKPNVKIIDLIAKRWSPRNYSDEKVPQEHIDQMLEAARWAPSGRNYEPWYFYHVQKPSKGYKMLFETLGENNKAWASSAPLYIVCCMDLNESNEFAYYDLGQATFSLVLEAHSLGYYCRQMARFDKEKVQKLINKNHKPYIIVAIGKLGDYTNVNEKVLENELDPRPRKEKIAEELK